MERLSIGPRSGLAKDARKDLGYGRSDANFHFPRAKIASFPYNNLEADSSDVGAEELSREDEELVRDIVRITMSDPMPTDSLIRRSIDRNAFVSGNQPIGESPSGKSMVPFPKMYSKRIQVGGGVNQPFAIRPGQYPRTGTTRGWSHAPLPIEDDIEFSEIEDGEPLELVKVRNMIKRIIAQESE